MLAVQFHIAERADEPAARVAGNVRGFLRMIKARGLTGVGNPFAGDTGLHREKQGGEHTREQRHTAAGTRDEFRRTESCRGERQGTLRADHGRAHL
jgi:hypothetical protein